MDFTTNTTLSNYLMLIISSSNTEQITEAWMNLKKLEDHELANLIDIIKMIIIKNDHIKNVYEIPKLLEYFSLTINDNPFEVNDTSNTNGYETFLRCIITESKYLDLLCLIIETLINHQSVYLPNYESIANFCKAIVYCLSKCSMPHKPEMVLDFKEKISIVYQHLSTTITLCKTKQKKQNLILDCTDTLYKIITDINSTPGAALVVIIQLVEPTFISNAVHSIIVKSSNDEHLSQLLSVLLVWLTQWLKNDTLFMWIEKFIAGLHNERRYSALNSASNRCLKIMLSKLMFPVARPHMMPFVQSMLVHMSTPTLFHNIIETIRRVLSVLLKDGKEDAIHCAQNLTNYVSVLIIRFPDYQSLKKDLPMQPQQDILIELLNVPQWTENNKLIINNYKSGSKNNEQVGLYNLGNTCYMNSILQALVMTPQFCNQILTYDENYMQKNKILYELQRLFALLLYSQRPYLSPIEFSRVSKPAYFTPGQQHDSAEFLCHLLDELYEQERSVMIKPKISHVILNDESLNNTSKIKLQRRTIIIEDNNLNNCNPTNYNTLLTDGSTLSSVSQSCLVYRVFGGESNTTYQCNKCQTSSHNNDHYWELQLSFPEEISRNREITVQNLIDYYLKPEKLTGDNMYYCDRCNSLCDAERIIKILRAPAHLILTLKHFHYNIDSRLKAKLFHKVEYNEIIEIPVLNNNKDFENYQLYAAVVHSGYSMDYGHYFTYARDRTKKWYKFNDSCVHETTLNDFFQLKAPYTPYILFYEKINDDLEKKIDEKPTLTSLSKNIRNYIAMDFAKYESERKNCIQNRSTSLAHDDDYYQLSTSVTRHRDNSDDDNPPPTNCRDSVDIQSNGFLY